MNYPLLKIAHVTFVVLSFSLFFLRGVWMIGNSPRLQARWVKIVPHVNDTALIVSAVLLAMSIGQYPFVHAWLTAKVAALLVYIGLGMVAMRFGNSRKTRIIAWVSAMLVFFYIVAVALTHNPLPALF